MRSSIDGYRERSFRLTPLVPPPCAHSYQWVEVNSAEALDFLCQRDGSSDTLGLAYPLHQPAEVVMPELSPEGEIIAAYGAATMAAFKILVVCLQSNGALEHGQFPEALRLFMEAAKGDADDMTLSMLHDLRMSILD